jgi:hypothetical protein
VSLVNGNYNKEIGCLQNALFVTEENEGFSIFRLRLSHLSDYEIYFPQTIQFSFRLPPTEVLFTRIQQQ